MTNRKKTVVISQDQNQMRIDKALCLEEDGISRSRLQKLLKEGNVLVNQKPVKPSFRLQTGDTVCVYIPESQPVSMIAESIPLDILYEDEFLLIVNKPQGMVVHPAPGHTEHTLVNAVMAHCGTSLSGINGELRPGIVHRIDKDTSGALVICKDDRTHQNLAEQLKEHTIHRLYHAVVHGNIKEDQGSINAQVGRHPTDRKRMSVHSKNGRHAVTDYQVIQRYHGRFTHIQCRLETGRTHQIRVHMASIGHPLAGDPLYNKNGGNPYHLPGQALHARILGFQHPATGKYLEVSAPFPESFLGLLERLKTVK